MSVLAKITKGVLRAPERAFCVNHPVGAEQRAKPRGEGLRILQRGECSMEGDFVLRMQRFEAIHELAPEHCFEYVNRQEEILLRVDPPRMVRRQPAGGNHTMNVRMMLEFLVPGGRNSAASRSTANGPETTRRREPHNEREDDAGVSGSRRKKFCCESIHREWSGDNPPAGTTQ